jgi:hypothetical protein
MTKKTNLALVGDDDEFDPTRKEGDDATSSEADMTGQFAAAFAAIPSNDQIKAAALDAFGKDLPDSILRTLLQETEEVSHSTRKILAEHMRMGGNFLNIRLSVTNAMVLAQGDTKQVRDRAAGLVYRYLQHLFRHSRSKIVLYIKCHERFFGNEDAMQILKLTDMQALIANETPDELVDLVIQARRDDPDLSKADVKKLIAGFDQARELVRDRDDRLDAMTEELTSIGGKLDEAKIENRRLLAERQALQQQIDRDKDSADMTKVELARVSQSVNSLQVKIANQERELENKHRELAEARTAVRVETKEVPTVPGEFAKMEDAIEEQLARLRQVRKDLEAEEARLAALHQQREQEEAALGAARVIEQKFESAIARFGDFTSDFSTLQLLVTADGNPGRFKSMFEALSDLVGKFREELLAATRAA